MNVSDLDDLIEFVGYGDDESGEQKTVDSSKSIMKEIQFHKMSSTTETLFSLANGLTSSSRVSQVIISVCSICFERFNSEGELYSHLIEQHGGRLKCQDQKSLLQLQNSNKEITGNKELKVAEETIPIPTTASPLARASDKSDDTVIVDDNHQVDVDDSNKNNKKSKSTQSEVPPLPLKYFTLLLRNKKKMYCKVSSNCPHKFEDKEKLHKHEQCHNSSTMEQCKDYAKFQCIECSMIHKTWRQCSNHLWKEHKIDVDLVHCPVCSYKSSTIALIWRHLRVHEKWKAKILQSLKFIRKRRHQSTQNCKNSETNIGSSGDKPAISKRNKYYAEKICEICGRKFVNGKTLSKHVKCVHHKIKSFICNVCGKKMARKAGLNIHMRQHTGEKPLQCKTCKFSTRDPSSLHKHELRHNEKKKFHCSLCDYQCVQSSAYKRHIRLKHVDHYKRICCDLCSYVTINEKYLKAHKNDHINGLSVSNNDDSTLGPRQTNNQNNEQSYTDCFLPMESNDLLPLEPTVDTGGVTIPAHSEDTQFATYLNN